MTADDEQAIGDAELSVCISAILQKADQDVQGALLAWRQALRCTQDWEGVAETQRATIAELERENAQLRQDLMDARESQRAYAVTLAGVRAALETNEDEDLAEEVAQLVGEHAALSRQNGELSRAIARMTKHAACTQQRLDRLIGAVGVYHEAVERIDGIQAAEQQLLAVYAEVRGA